MAISEKDLEFTRFHARATGITAVAGVLFICLADLILPRTPAGIVGALSLLVTVGCGAQCVFQTATLISHRLQGRSRLRFQVAVSLSAPVVIAFILVSRVEAVPLETLSRMLTPWLVVPAGLIGLMCWAAGGVLDRDHPFRAFLIASATLGVLCLFWTQGMTSDADFDSESGSHFYLDPEKAAEARATGEFVWRFLVYVSVAYLALFLRLKLRRRVTPQDEAVRKLNEAMTPDGLQHGASGRIEPVDQDHGTASSRISGQLDRVRDGASMAWNGDRMSLIPVSSGFPLSPKKRAILISMRSGTVPSMTRSHFCFDPAEYTTWQFIVS